MNRAIYGTVFWISAPEKLATLHKIIRVEDINQLVRKTVHRFCISLPSDSSDNHTGTDGYIHLAFLQLTFVNKYSMLTLSNLMYTYMENA
jgi:hypothetical protein